MSDESHDSPRTQRPSPVRSVARGTGRALSWPIKNTLEAPGRVFNDGVLSLAEWRSLNRAATPRDLEADLTELDARERYWADPRNWPAVVHVYVRMNIEASALIFAGLGGVAFAALIESLFTEPFTLYERLCLIGSGLMGLFVAGGLYAQTCLDHARLTRDLRMPWYRFFAQPALWWPFDGHYRLRDFIAGLPHHIVQVIDTRPPPTREQRAIRGMLWRAAWVLSGLVTLIFTARIVGWLGQFPGL